MLFCSPGGLLLLKFWSTISFHAFYEISPYCSCGFCSANEFCFWLQIDENVQREIINHRSLRHPNIVRFKERIRTCLIGEVESPSSPIRRHAPDVKYPEKVERRLDRIPDARYPEKVERQPDRIPDVRYLEKVERWPDRIPNVRYPEKVERRPDIILSRVE
ncbi:hypothetical protein VitviT2T_002325 [Vitis vinifera]|uniref:Uncharacterized protein n=1 Tax=Vitis vinifera TaxID=29760 RepID=A0ABY9BI39_VITVI|nr:hypothetical protein VitviT2T_002325 [Vitis vinifera]